MIELLYQDDHMLICLKPAGVSAQDAQGQNVPELLRQQLGLAQVYPVHRLDKAVGGVMVYALTQKAALMFQEKNGAYICRTLLSLGTEGADDPTPEKRTASYYKKRPCSEYVRDCAQIVQDIIDSMEN